MPIVQLNPGLVREEVRNLRALSVLEQTSVLETGGHFDYGNGFHGSVYLHFHLLLRVAYNIWQMTQELKDAISPTLRSQVQVVAGPITGGVIVGANLATVIDSSRVYDEAYEPVYFAPIGKRGERLELRNEYLSVVRDRKVLLVDDVRNTGQTLWEAAELLTRAGAEVIATAVLFDFNEPTHQFAVPNFAAVKCPIKNARQPANDCCACKLGIPINRF